MKTYVRQNWRRLAVANLSSFALQAGLFALLACCGLDGWISCVLAKAGSWAAFALQVAWPALRRVVC